MLIDAFSKRSKGSVKNYLARVSNSGRRTNALQLPLDSTLGSPGDALDGSQGLSGHLPGNVGGAQGMPRRKTIFLFFEISRPNE